MLKRFWKRIMPGGTGDVRRPRYEKKDSPPGPGPEGEKIKQEGENPYLSMDLKKKFVKEKMAEILGDQAAAEEAFEKSMTSGEIENLPRIDSKEDLAELAQEVAERTLPELPDEAVEELPTMEPDEESRRQAEAEAEAVLKEELEKRKKAAEAEAEATLQEELAKRGKGQKKAG